MKKTTVRTGLEVLVRSPLRELKRASLGLLCNQSSLLPDLIPGPEAVEGAFPGRLKALFSPQHGFFAEKQDNMVESPHGRHPRLGVRVYSLYGETRRPELSMLKGLDVILIDLSDLGCRVYTFFTTALYMMEACAKAGISVWVLDRPNPLGRGEEGPILPPELHSFVGPHPIPLRHGLSLGELCRLAAAEKRLDLDLMVIPAAGWRGQYLGNTGQGWVMPSPNMPTLDTCRVYPGQVLLEGTTLSEGRGTTRPFEIFGAPGLDPWAVAAQLEPQALAGARLRPLFFQPTFHKHKGQVCGGFQIHLEDESLFRPVRLTLGVLGALSRAQPGIWGLRPPPYEYETEKRPLDLLLGDPQGVAKLHKGAFVEEIEAPWQEGLAKWGERTGPHLLYPV